jgi:error-prone DNA polymerase
MERYRRVLMGARLLLVEGRLQKHGSIIHVVVDHLKDWTHHLIALSDTDRVPQSAALARTGETARPTTDPNRLRSQPHRHPRNVRIMPKSRDFH